MLIKKILDTAQPQLKGKSVTDLVIGLSLIACQLDTGEVGVSYVLRDNLPNGCSAFAFAQEVTGKSASEVAQLAVTGKNDIQRSVATSVLVAASQGQDIPNDDGDMPFGVPFKPDDTVGMIGMIVPVAKQLEPMVGKMIVFDRGLEQCGGHPMLSPMAEQEKLLPTCDVVLLSGTTTINGSIDSLLGMCASAREVVLVGPSSPMYTQAFAGSAVTRVAGSWWKNDEKDAIFKAVSLGGGIRQVSPYMIKKTAPVK